MDIEMLKTVSDQSATLQTLAECLCRKLHDCPLPSNVGVPECTGWNADEYACARCLIRHADTMAGSRVPRKAYNADETEIRALAEGRKTTFRVPVGPCIATPGTAPFEEGDLVVVREPWHADWDTKNHVSVPRYKADSGPNIGTVWNAAKDMPDSFSRYTLRVKKVRLEAAESTTLEDILNEGFDAEVPPICRVEHPTEAERRKMDKMDEAHREEFIQNLALHTYIGWCSYSDEVSHKWKKSWDDKHPHGKWDDVPMLWVVEFEQVEKAG